MREQLKKWGKPVLFAAALWSGAYIVGVGFAQGVRHSGGLFHLTVNYVE